MRALVDDAREDDYWRCAQRAMHSGQFRLALDLLTKLMLTSSVIDLDIRMKVWEGRASCFEKLGDLASARREAMQMISAQTNNARGYLRMGKILRLARANEEALRIYRLGVKRCSGPGVVHLTRQIDAMVARQDGTPSQYQVDVFGQLPVEILDLIFRYCSVATVDELGKCTKSGIVYRRHNHSLTRRLVLGSSDNAATVVAGIKSEGSIGVRQTVMQSVHCSSPAAFERFLRIAGRLDVRSVYLSSLDLSAHETDQANQSFLPQLAWTKIQRIYLCRCRISPLILYQIVRQAKHLTRLIIRDPVVIRGMEAHCQIALQKCRAPFVVFTSTGLRHRSLPLSPHLVLSNWEHLMALGRNPILQIAHCTSPVEDLSVLINLLPGWPNLLELGIHMISIEEQKRRVDPCRLLQAIFAAAPRLRVLCLPIFDRWPAQTKHWVSNKHPFCRIIFDPTVSCRLMDRHYFACPSSTS